MSTINFKFTTKLENKIHENSQQSSVHGPQKLKPHKTFNHEGHEESQRKKTKGVYHEARKQDAGYKLQDT
jgi:hypothetical protein